jgi:hypothetical protein
VTVQQKRNRNDRYHQDRDKRPTSAIEYFTTKPAHGATEVVDVPAVEASFAS